jgi:RNA polymerase sigma-70 factor (ECF subfamily)
MSTEMEKQLVDACRSGDAAAYEQLVKRHAKRVFAVCLGIIGRVHDAEDIAQEALIKGFTHLGRLRSGERFGPWITTIARNRCYDFLRRRKKSAEILQGRNPSPSTAPAEYDDLHAAITKLPEKYRLPLMLYYFDGKSSESVADALSLSTAGVLTRLSRARRELRRLLALEGGAQ